MAENKKQKLLENYLKVFWLWILDCYHLEFLKLLYFFFLEIFSFFKQPQLLSPLANNDIKGSELPV